MKISQSRICQRCGGLQFVRLDHRHRTDTIRMGCGLCGGVQELRPVAGDRPEADVPGGAA
jgi:hypothetical protein